MMRHTGTQPATIHTKKWPHHLASLALVVLATVLVRPAMATETVTLFVTNAQGSVVATMTPQGQVTYTAAYRPYGKKAQGPAQPGPGYTGHVMDPTSGLVYMQQRYYDPEVGRFISPDPIAPAPGNVFNFGRYTYANNNPVANIDPTGAYTCVDNGPSNMRDSPINCNTVNRAVEYLHQAARNPTLSAPAHAQVLRILKRLGKANTPNGVVIYTAGHTIKGKDVGGGTILNKHGTVEIGLQLARNYTRSGSGHMSSTRFAKLIAAKLGHEGTHMLDAFSYGNPTDWQTEYATELRASRTEAWVYKGLNFRTSMWSPETGVVRSQVYAGAMRSTNTWCGRVASCRTYYSLKAK